MSIFIALLSRKSLTYSISIFYFTFYLFGGAYAPNATPPLPTGLHSMPMVKADHARRVHTARAPGKIA